MINKLFLLSIFGLLISLNSSAQPNTAAFPSIHAPTGTKTIERGNPYDIMEQAIKAWGNIYHCRIQLHQAEKLPGKPVNELWANVILFKPTQEKMEYQPSFSLQFYSHPNALNIKDTTPEMVFYAAAPNENSIPKLFTYNPNKKTIQIEWLDENSPLPDFLKLAGFLKFDAKEIHERAYLEDDIYEEYINGTPTIRVRLKPRTKMQNVEPDRYIWLHRDTYFPVRFAVDDIAQVIVDFDGYLFNQEVDPKSIVPIVPGDSILNDLTQ